MTEKKYVKFVKPAKTPKPNKGGCYRNVDGKLVADAPASAPAAKSKK